jgi:hypothetical protein
MTSCSILLVLLGLHIPNIVNQSKPLTLSVEGCGGARPHTLSEPTMLASNKDGYSSPILRWGLLDGRI